MIPCYTILHLTVLAMQHPFQLYLQRSHLCTYDWLTRTSIGNKKQDILPPFIKVKALLFSIQYEHADFLCVL